MADKWRAPAVWLRHKIVSVPDAPWSISPNKTAQRRAENALLDFGGDTSVAWHLYVFTRNPADDVLDAVPDLRDDWESADDVLRQAANVWGMKLDAPRRRRRYLENRNAALRRQDLHLPRRKAADPGGAGTCRTATDTKQTIEEMQQLLSTNDADE